MPNKVGGGTGRRASLNKSVDSPKTAGTTARRREVSKPSTFDTAKGTTARREEINKRLSGERVDRSTSGSTSRRSSIWKEIKED